MNAPESKLPGLDWGELHRRLSQVQEALENAGRFSPERQEKILKERALALAAIDDGEAVAEDAIEFVAVQIGEEQYGFESVYLREILLLKDITPLSTAPPFVAGIISVRGQILSVVDLRIFFDLPRKGMADQNTVLLLRSSTMEFGVLADKLLGVRRLAKHERQPAPSTLTGMREGYLLGLASDRLLLLDTAKLLSDSKMIVYEEVQD